MTGNYLNKILSVNAKHALYREDGKWYHNLTQFPGVLFDKNGYIIFKKEEDYINNSKLQIKKDLHIINGIESLDNYSKFTEREKELIKGMPLELRVKMIMKRVQFASLEKLKSFFAKRI